MQLRNWAFDVGILKQESFDVPIIAVGNLSTGGTGKTPMIEYLITQFQDQKVAVLSRGYGRKTKGYRLVETSSTAQQVGDEPLQIKKKFGDRITVAVCEKRVDGVNQLILDFSPDVILLDDAFQHRYVKADHHVLLTAFGDPYFNNNVLPAGNLREPRSGAIRAHSIVVTKCPPDLNGEAMQSIIDKIKPATHQNVFFATITYSDLLVGQNIELPIKDLQVNRITAVTGIAKPQPFIDHLSQFFSVNHSQFSDHHDFTIEEIQRLKEEEIIITTEKDFMRLAKYDFNQIYYLPMQTEFIGEMPQIDLADLKH
jgi:tetraacyldisaccharide 4'-kinase